MIRMVSLDELLEREYAREREWCEAGSGQFAAALLDEVPEEDTRRGYYNGKPKDLVSLFREAE